MENLQESLQVDLKGIPPQMFCKKFSENFRSSLQKFEQLI